MKRGLLLLFVLVLMGAFIGDLAATGVRERQPDYRLQLLHFADIDGQPEALDHVANFSRLLQEFENVYPYDTLIVSSGDNYIPGPRYFAAGDDAMASLLGVPAQGRGDIVFLNEFGVAASAVGNHDLDSGPEGFVQAIAPESSEEGSYSGAQFPFLATNLDFSADENTAPLVTHGGQVAAAIPHRLAPSAVTVVGGEVIGLVGASTPRLGSITSTGNIGVLPGSGEMEALAANIQRSVDALTARGIDKIILLSHMQQISVEKELAGMLSDVDIIVAGGSNTLLADDNDRLRPGDEAADTYPLELSSATGDPVLVVNVDGDYRYLGRLVVEFDRDGVILTDRLDSRENGSWGTHDEAMRGVASPADPEVEAIVSGIREVLQRREGNVLGRTGVYLDGRRSEVRTEETNLGNLTADANLWYARQHDSSTAVSIKNGGGIRAAIGDSYVPAGSVDYEPELIPPPAIESVGKPEGGISQFDIEGSLRFNNGLTLLTVTAAELYDIMEHAVAGTAEGATPGQFPQVGGMRFSFDPSRSARSVSQENMGADTDGSRIRDLVIVNDAGSVTDRVVIDGELQGDPQRTITLVTLGFLADGGDDYPFAGLNAPNRRNLTDDGSSNDPGRASFAGTGSEQDALAEYLRARYASEQNAYDRAETPPAEDRRIQNLRVRESTIR